LPALRGKARTKSRCLDDNSPTWLPDTVCSESWVYQTTYTRSAIKNNDAPYLSEDERYWFEYSAWWLPQGDSNPSSSLHRLEVLIEVGDLPANTASYLVPAVPDEARRAQVVARR